jgi:hypothetical protein
LPALSRHRLSDPSNLTSDADDVPVMTSWLGGWEWMEEVMRVKRKSKLLNGR